MCAVAGLAVLCADLPPARYVFFFLEPALLGGVSGVDNAWDTKPMIDDVLPCKMKLDVQLPYAT